MEDFNPIATVNSITNCLHPFEVGGNTVPQLTPIIEPTELPIPANGELFQTTDQRRNRREPLSEAKRELMIVEPNAALV